MFPSEHSSRVGCTKRFLYLCMTMLPLWHACVKAPEVNVPLEPQPGNPPRLPEIIAFVSDKDTGFLKQIYIMKSDGTGRQRITHDSTDYACASFSPDGRRLLAWSQTNDNSDEIFLMNLDGSNLINLTHSPGDDNDAAFNADGTKISFVSARDGHCEIYIMDTNGGNQTRLTRTTDDDAVPGSNRPHQQTVGSTVQRTTAHSPQFTPDGSRILYYTTARDESGEYPFDSFVLNYRLYMINVDGSEQETIGGEAAFFARAPELNNPAARYLKPGFSPNGSRIVFVSYIPNSIYHHKLYVLDSLTGTSRLVLTGDIQTPVFVPNDPMLVITSHADGKFDLYEVSVWGTGVRKLTNGVPGHIAFSQFSPDGSKILFSTDVLGYTKIWVMNRDGSVATQLTFGEGNDLYPNFQPVPGK